VIRPLRAPGARRLSAALSAALALLPLAAAAWSGAQHVQIGRAAGRNMPREMAAFEAFSRPMAYPSMFPDLWRNSDPNEGPRHYFEPDRLPRSSGLLDLSPDRDQAFATQIAETPEAIGIAPWTVVDLMRQMTDAMRTNDWLWAARCGAALSHYLADLHMPLHCTRNYNGQESGQDGIHSRIESEMTKAFFKADQISLRPAEYLSDPFQSILRWTGESFAIVPDWLAADRMATRAANGRTDTETYYLKLWELTEESVVERIGSAAVNLSSIWYTAWVDAGRPAIPAPFDELPPHSVFSGVGIDPPDPFGPTVHRQKQTFDLIVWAVMAAFALVVVGSSIYRSRNPKP
jgi:hypothetical protein